MKHNISKKLLGIFLIIIGIIMVLGGVILSSYHIGGILIAIVAYCFISLGSHFYGT